MIVSRHGRGIGNRLKSLLSAMRIDRAARVVWPVNEYCGARWGDLFDNAIEQPSLLADDREVGVWRLVTLEEDGCGDTPIDWLYERTPAGARKAFLPLITRLRPVRAVQQRVAQFRKLTDDDVAGVSVRTWKETHIRPFNIDKLFRILDRERALHLFLTCDNAAVFDSIRRQYGARVVCVPRRTEWGDWHTAAGCQDILADLYLAGRCRRLYASYRSTFSELQWWFGGCKAAVTEFNHFDSPERRPRNWAKYLKGRRAWANQ